MEAVKPRKGHLHKCDIKLCGTCLIVVPSVCLSGCAEESLYVSDPSRSNPAARTFTRQRDVERVLAMINEGALVRRPTGREKEGEEEEQGSLQ